MPRASSSEAFQPGWAAAAVGLLIWLDAVIAALVLRADEERVYVLGRPIGWVCALRSQLHLPCPTCGLTRSLVLSLHGEIGRAWDIAPVGPVALYGLFAFATGLLVMAVMPPQHAQPPQRNMWMRRFALAYGGIVIALWIGGWAHSFAAAFELSSRISR